MFPLDTGKGDEYHERMEKRVVISAARLREQGELQQIGEVDSGLLDLREGNLLCSGPVKYELQAKLYGEEAVVELRAEVPMHGKCDRCLADLDYTVAVNVEQGVDLEGQEDEIDLSELVREELILAIPAYPKCELTGKKCQINDINGDFGLDKAPQPGVNSAAPSHRSVWDALDGIEAPSPDSSGSKH